MITTQQCFALLLTSSKLYSIQPIIWIFTEGEGDGIESRLSSKSFLLYVFQIYLTKIGNSNVPDDFEELGRILQMNPVHSAAYFESPDALPLLLRQLQIILENNRNNPEEITKIKKIIHSKANLGGKKSSLLLDVMTNKNLIKSGNLLVVFEENIHKGRVIWRMSYEK